MFWFPRFTFFPCLLKCVNREAKRERQFFGSKDSHFLLVLGHWRKSLAVLYITPIVYMPLLLLTWSFRVLTLYCHCVLVQITLSSTWCEMEVGKSAIYALLSRCMKCRKLRILGAGKKTVSPGIRAKKTEIPALAAKTLVP